MLIPAFRSALACSALTLLICAGSAHAQYVWLDAQGRKQYSDMPPPASVPANRILKQPGGALAADAPVDAKAEASRPAPKEAPPAAPTLAEREADFRKRRAEQAEKEKKAAEEAQRQADNKKRCEQIRDYQRSLEAGELISKRDKNGERVLMSDAERASELQDAKRALEDCK